MILALCVGVLLGGCSRVHGTATGVDAGDSQPGGGTGDSDAESPSDSADSLGEDTGPPSDGVCPDFTVDLVFPEIGVRLSTIEPALRYGPVPIYLPAFGEGGGPRLLIDDLQRTSQSVYLLEAVPSADLALDALPSLALDVSGYAVGASVAEAGDHDGDGLDDFVVGGETPEDEVRAWVVYGPELAIGDPVAAELPSDGRGFDGVGGGGDLNEDGYEEVWMALNGAAPEVRVLAGGPDRSGPREPMLTYFGAPPYLLRQNALILEATGDATPDLVLGLPESGGGSVLVLAGPLAGTASDLDAITHIEGESHRRGNDQYGYHLGTGDLVGGGVPGLLVGSYASGNYYGSTALWWLPLPLPVGEYRADGNVGTVAYDDVYLDGLGGIAVGDLDGNGIDDVVVAYAGAPDDRVAVQTYGVPAGSNPAPDPAVMLSMGVDERAGDAAVGDLDGDGCPELAVGVASGSGDAGEGAVYLAPAAARR